MPLKTSPDYGSDNIYYVGNSPEAKRINRAIKKYSKSDKNILLLGEVGTGKEHTARRIHSLGSRKNGPFVTINCAVLGYTLNRLELLGSESVVQGSIRRKIGLIEKANKGILFLDNLDAAPPDYQFLLYQVLSEAKLRREGGQGNVSLDIRVISTFTRNIKEDVNSGLFRKDLYYLIKPLAIDISPLRARKQDIPELMLFFLKQYCNEKQVSIPAVPAEIFESVLEYDWRGNVRELKDCVENLVLMSAEEELSTKYFPFEIKRHPLDVLEVKNLNRVVTEVETYLITKALRKFAGNQVKAARQLGLPEATLRFKIRKYAILKKS